MVDYFGKLTTIWDELENYEKDSKYCCGGQECTRITNGEPQHEEKRLHKVLLGLDNSFHTITSQILNMNHRPSIDSAYNMLIQKEKHCVIARDQDVRVEAVAFAA